jgi:hypothetical protein
MRRADAFIQANRGGELRLQHGVIDDVVVAERLFDHHQVIFVQAPQAVRVGEGVGGVRIGH